MSPSVAPTPDANRQPLPPLKVDSGSVDLRRQASKRDEAKGVDERRAQCPRRRPTSCSRAERSAVRPIAADHRRAHRRGRVTTDTTKVDDHRATQTRARSRSSTPTSPALRSVTMPQAIELTNLDQPTPTANGIDRSADGNSLQPLGEFLGVRQRKRIRCLSAARSPRKQKVGTSGDNDLAQRQRHDAQRASARLGPGRSSRSRRILQTVELADDLSRLT